MVAIAAKCDGTRSETLHQLLGELLYPLVERSQPDRAGRITGMLLQLPDAEVALLIQSDEALSARLVEAADLLDGHISAREEALSDGAAADEASAGAPLPAPLLTHDLNSLTSQSPQSQPPREETTVGSHAIEAFLEMCKQMGTAGGQATQRIHAEGQLRAGRQPPAPGEQAAVVAIRMPAHAMRMGHTSEGEAKTKAGLPKAATTKLERQRAPTEASLTGRAPLVEELPASASEAVGARWAEQRSSAPELPTTVIPLEAADESPCQTPEGSILRGGKARAQAEQKPAPLPAGALASASDPASALTSLRNPGNVPQSAAAVQAAATAPAATLAPASSACSRSSSEDLAARETSRTAAKPSLLPTTGPRKYAPARARLPANASAVPDGAEWTGRKHDGTAWRRWHASETATQSHSSSGASCTGDVDVGGPSSTRTLRALYSGALEQSSELGHLVQAVNLLLISAVGYVLVLVFDEHMSPPLPHPSWA